MSFLHQNRADEWGKRTHQKGRTGARLNLHFSMPKTMLLCVTCWEAQKLHRRLQGWRGPELVRYEGLLSQPCLPPPGIYHDHALCCTLREQKDVKTPCQFCGPKDQVQKFWKCPVLPRRRTRPLQAQIILDIHRNLRTLTRLVPDLHTYSEVILHGFTITIKWPKNTWREHLHALDPESYGTLWKIHERLSCDSSSALST